MKTNTDRRLFLKFMGASSLATMSSISTLTGCATSKDFTPAQSIKPSTKDELVLPEGLSYEVLIKWADKITDKESFGFNNDYIEWVSKSNDELVLWVNHEYFDELWLHGKKLKNKTKNQVDKERYQVGGSIIHIKKNNGSWKVVHNSKYNKRITATTKIPLIAQRTIAGKRYAVGTLANCAGGKTPWKTFLTAEENYDGFYGELDKDGNFTPSFAGWEKYYKNSPHHYGWITEINPITGKAKKLTGLGRFAHECATCFQQNQKTVVYTGDDKADEHLYRFIASESGSLEKGELFVANINKKKWISMDITKHKVLKDNFKDQLDVLIHARDAAKLLGATPLDRPEDIEIHPVTGDVYVCCTNNKGKNRPHGKIFKISYNKGNHFQDTFRYSEFIIGGPEIGLTCPDNLTFDKNGNMWVTNDISGSAIEKGPYKGFGNNGLYFIPMSGPSMGKVFQIASAPKDAELTGLKFSPDYKTLFLSVQHPGSRTKDINTPTSTWPNRDGTPRPSVVTIQGPLLDKLMS